MEAGAAPFASVIVCTRDRGRTLLQTTEALLALDYPAGRWELVIVDNGSRDNTLQLAHEVQRRHPNLVRVIAEPEPGLSAARNAGIAQSRGEVVAFTDDDAFVDPGWLRALAAALGEDGTLAAGGPIEPLFTGERPAWLGDRFLPYLSAWDRGAEPHALTYNEYPRGTNMAFRREVFARFGGFSRDLGRNARSLLSCEETELCLRVERGGGRILYVPAARVRHLTPTGRITPRWLEERFFAQGRSEAILEWRHGGWRGLRHGWRRWWRMDRQATRSRQRTADDALYARCVRRALLGHSSGTLTAPWTVPRYRPAGAADAPWLPVVPGGQPQTGTQGGRRSPLGAR